MALIVAETPGYKTKCLVGIFPLQKPARSWQLVCFGPKRHYRKDGSCVHTEFILTSLKSDWHRRRTRVDGWGAADGPRRKHDANP